MAPSPNAAPSRPMPLARSSSVVVSAMTAIAVGSVADDSTPARVRAMNRCGIDCPSANSVMETPYPASPTSITGLRPMRSESRPHSGLNTNCASE